MEKLMEGSERDSKGKKGGSIIVIYEENTNNK
jgi:hypothetical protein